MEEIFGYSQYGQVLCLHFSDYEYLIIYRSSNRLINIEKVDIHVKDELLEFFKLQLKSENQQTGDEKFKLLSIINFIKELKHKIIKEDIFAFDNSQILICLPAEWTGDKYENDLRILFLNAGWISKEDHKNRLIFSPFIERFVCRLQMAEYINIKFERERKYLLFYMDNTSIRLTYYQMQCAKELIAVSKKLAVSDFLLTPTVLHDETVCLPNLHEVIHNRIESMLATRQNATNTTLKKPMLRKLTDEILQHLDLICSDVDTSLATFLSHKVFSDVKEMAQEYIEVLEAWNRGTFIKEILDDAEIEQIIHKVVDIFKRILGKYRQVENSPDGIQAIILGGSFYLPRLLYKELVLDILLNAKITEAKSNFIDSVDEIELIWAAMQKPYKMIQIANALLPPDILSKDKLSLYPNLFEHGWHENDLLQPNSFYVQAYVYENHINFILNKVVAVSSINNVVQKSTFTIQERSINIENITDTVCDIMWNHFQALDFEDYDNRFFLNCCNEHDVGESNAENYFNFKTNLKILISNWFQDENMFSNQELDIYQSISTNINCKCALNITYRMLIELALRPAITSLATFITLTLASNDLFGLYGVSALIIIRESKNVILNRFDSTLKEAIQKRLQIYQKRPVVFHGQEELLACKSLGNWVNNVKGIIGLGSYSQVSSTSYLVRVIMEFQEADEWFDCSSKLYEFYQMKQACSFYILKKDDYLHQEGVIKRFIIENYDDFTDPFVDIFILRSSETSETRNSIIRFYINEDNFGYPLTIKISPQHYSSTIKIEVSYVQVCSFFLDYSESITIHEKLVLKQH